MTSQNAVPPDGGWGWVFVAGCALQWFFHGGLVRSFSLIYEQMLVRFGASASATAAVYSFNIASSLLIAPLSAALSTKVTPRQGVLIGTSIMFTGMMATAFAPSIVVVYFTYGIMAGTGSGIIATMRFITTPLWFRKNLGRAMSFILMTDGLGTMALSPLLDFMFGYYGYTGTMMFIAAISLHGLVIAMVMIPLPHPHQQNSTSGVIVEGIIEEDHPADDKDKEFGGKSPQLPRSRTHSLNSRGDENKEWVVSFEVGISRLSISNPNCNINRSTTNISTEDNVAEQLASCELITTNHTASSPDDTDEKTYKFEAAQIVANNLPNLKNGSAVVQNGSHQQVTKTEGNGPLNLPNGGSHSETDQVIHDSSSTCDGCLSKFYTYLDVRLLGSSQFFAFSLLMTSSSLCSSMSNTHMAGMAMDRAVPSHQVAILLAIIGAVAVVAKFTSGFVFDLRCFKAVRTPVFGAMGATCGLLLIFIPVTSGAPMFAFMWVLNSVILSTLVTQESVILNDLVPRKCFASAIGLSRFFRGIGVMVGPTVGGFLKDTTGNYTSTLYFGGSIFFLASMIFEMNVLRRHLGICNKDNKTR